MRVLFTLVALSLALGITAPAVAVEEPPTVCSTDARVAWSTDHETLSVTGATVTVPGCSDDEAVGFQVITNDGDVPEEMIFAAVADERATFDLTPYDIGIEPTVGVRVALESRGAVITDPDVDVLPDSEERPPSATDGGGTDGDGQTSVLPDSQERDGRSGRLPFTGAALELLVGLGLGLLLAGSGVLARRRRDRDTSPQR